MSEQLTERVTAYWNNHIHDMSIVRHPIGTLGFFDDLEEYRFDKQRYLTTVVDFSAYRDKNVLEVGCGVGLDLARFAMHGARVTGVDLSQRAIELSRTNFELHSLKGTLLIMDGTCLEFQNDQFDLVYAHGVLPYSADITKVIAEIHRVLKPGSEAILQFYNQHSWLFLLSKIMRVKLEHEDSPVFRTHTARGCRVLLKSFSDVHLLFERFPVRTRLHKGLRGTLYNMLFVGTFNAIPRSLVRRFGWHIIATVRK